ncbi:ABC transporter permease [Flavobacterium selenitireducens]|uniref:ABC transporter permease n=1 Tax=Flavobacterium selenitireducens TaxID=2722704 RepID=UPI00168C0651|nr:ABC transporter permease [Flavobacterium selenitireducens]MBD3583444.1 ABC transporter permease [Flavobacterium selenitireducens]
MDPKPNEEQWDLVIKGHSSLFDLKFADVWRYRDLLGMFVKRDFISFYKQTILGPLWFFIQPIFTTLVFTFIFGNLAGIQTDGLPQPLFYLCGITAWNYFSDCLTKTSTVFRDNANIFGKVYFPRLIMPLSIVVSNLVRFGVQLSLLAVMMAYYAIAKPGSFEISGALLLFPLLILLMAALGLGAGLIITAMTTKYRDLTFLVTFGVQLLMYGTTVIYPLSEAKSKFSEYAWIIEMNPMTGIIEAFRYAFLGQGNFTLASIGYSAIVTLVVLFAGVVIFNKTERNFVDTI